MKEEKEKKKNVWNYILIVFVILGIIIGYLSYLQDKKMDKMEEELDRTKMEQIYYQKTNNEKPRYDNSVTIEYIRTLPLWKKKKKKRKMYGITY